MNHLKAFPAHFLMYAVTALTFVSKVPALGVLAPYSQYITAAGALVAALHHSYETGAGTKVAAVASSAPVKLMLVAMLMAPLFMVGCKTAPTVTESAGISVAVDIATGAAIQEGVPQSEYASRAAEFKAIAVELKTVNDAGSATLATLAADLQPQISKLPPADQLAANVLVAALTPYLNAELQSNDGLKNVQTTLDVVLQAVIDACTAYGAPTLVVPVVKEPQIPPAGNK